MLSEQWIRIFLHEAFHHRKAVVAAFIAINLAIIPIGLNWPMGYRVSSTVVVEETNIIQPLMQGAAVPTGVVDRARLAREIIVGRKLMGKVLEQLGETKDRTPAEQEQAISRMVARTHISNEGRNLIRIEYRDGDPDRAYMTGKLVAELYIEESMAAKAAESQAAFEFIDKQVQEYHEKLTRAEEALKEFRSANLDAQPGSDADLSSRLGTLQSRIEETTRELQEAEIRKTSLERQLSGEAETASAISRESQYRARLSELQAQLDTLRLSYHETYPDIVRLRHQIDDLNQAIAAERNRREQARATGVPVLDDVVVHNPMYQQLRRELSQTNVQIDTLKARIAQAHHALQAELERGRRIQGSAAQHAELTRDYQVNREIYQDLLRRRENARVSMNLDRENQGLTLKIQEPAVRPIHPSGPRYWHFVIAGLVLGFAAPVALLYAKVQFDPRVRLPGPLVERYKVPLLVSVPHWWSARAVAAARRETQWLTLVVAGALLLILSIAVLRSMRVL